MTFSKQLLLVIFMFIFFFLPLLHASEANRCSSSPCGNRNIDVRFPFWLSPKQSASCVHTRFNLRCTDRPESSSPSLRLYNSILLILKLICLSLMTLLLGITTCVIYVTFSSEMLPIQIRRSLARHATRKPPRGRARSAIVGVYKKVIVEENMKLPGRNDDNICPICLSEYASSEAVGCLYRCEHCFHVKCIDTWLQLRSSCPICRNSLSTRYNIYD
ncbi:hypothetical protein N665_1687s0004 [Sinapis alba]|nr:hypothetical protein N665_1687s0004 [Sinapis alba]